MVAVTPFSCEEDCDSYGARPPPVYYYYYYYYYYYQDYANYSARSAGKKMIFLPADRKILKINAKHMVYSLPDTASNFSIWASNEQLPHPGRYSCSIIFLFL